MTKTEKQFVDDQRKIIESKTDEDNLNRYATLLSAADLSHEVRSRLEQAVEKKRKKFDPDCAMAVNGDMDDFN